MDRNILIISVLVVLMVIILSFVAMQNKLVHVPKLHNMINSTDREDVINTNPIRALFVRIKLLITKARDSTRGRMNLNRHYHFVFLNIVDINGQEHSNHFYPRSSNGNYPQLRSYTEQVSSCSKIA